jgi:hypothetical protein
MITGRILLISNNNEADFRTRFAFFVQCVADKVAVIG